MSGPQQVDLSRVVPPVLPAQFGTDSVPLPDGGHGVLIKLVAPGACVTVVVTPGDAVEWSRRLAAVAQKAGSQLIVAPAMPPEMLGRLNGRPG